jgi:hypothetical protein
VLESLNVPSIIALTLQFLYYGTNISYFNITITHIVLLGYAVAQLVEAYAASRKVASSFPNVIRFFN